jgi:hypothetical protein
MLDNVDSEAGVTTVVVSGVVLLPVDFSPILRGDVLLDSSSSFVRTTTTCWSIRPSLSTGSRFFSPLELLLVRGTRGLRVKKAVIGLWNIRRQFEGRVLCVCYLTFECTRRHGVKQPVMNRV